jgi:hypothetical protein
LLNSSAGLRHAARKNGVLPQDFPPTFIKYVSRENAAIKLLDFADTTLDHGTRENGDYHLRSNYLHSFTLPMFDYIECSGPGGCTS